MHGAERRRAQRHEMMGLLAHISCRNTANSEESSYAVGDLSPLGALLLGPQRFDVGTQLAVRLEAPGQLGVHLKATVVRCFEGVRNTRIGLQFEPLDPVASTFVADVIHSEQLRHSDPVVLVVSRGASAAMRLWGELDDAGCSARVVSSLDDGISAIHDRDLPVCAVLVDSRRGPADEALAFAQRAASALPKARVVLLGGPTPDGELKFEHVTSSGWTHARRVMLFGNLRNDGAGSRP